MKCMCKPSSILLFGFILPFLAIPLIWAQTNVIPQAQPVYGATVGRIKAIELPGATDITRVFVATESPNSVFYGDVDHSSANPYLTNNFSFAVVPDMNADANHGTPSFIAVHELSGMLFIADEEDGLMSCSINTNSIVTNITGIGIQSVLIEGSSLFAMSRGMAPEDTNALYYATLNTSGVFTAGAALLSEPFTGTPSMAVHPVNHALYILTASQQVDASLKKSSTAYDAFNGGTTFSPVPLPSGITNWTGAKRLGIGPDGRLFIGSSTGGTFIVAYSTDDGTSWTNVNTEGGTSGVSAGLNVETIGSSNAYEVFFGTAASSNKGEAGTWQMLPRGGHGASPSTHANGGCIMADPINTQIIYLTTDKGVGLSTNRGVDISELNEGLLAFQINDIDVTASKDVVWLASKSGVRIATSFSTSPVWYDADFPDAIVHSAAMDQSDPSGLTGYAGSVRVYKTTTGGGTDASSWSQVLNESIHGMSDGEIKAIEVDGNDVLVGCYGYSMTTCEGGVFLSDDGGATWTNIITGIDVNDIALREESGVGVAYIAVSLADAADNGGIYRYVEGSGYSKDLTNAVDIRDLALDNSDGIYASGSIANSDPSTRQVIVYYKASGATTWTLLTTTGLPSDTPGANLVGRGAGPVITVGKDSSSNEVPVLAIEKTLYYLPYGGGTSWTSIYTYPNGTAINALFWDDLLVGTAIGLYGQETEMEPGTSRVVVADFDGDGKSDVAVYNEATGYWFILLSSTGALYYNKLGGTGYTPVPADYDGDAKADMAVFNETTGWWYYILSTTPGTLGYSKLGEAGYTPVPADYDGDAKADLAVFNETTGWWYYILSTTPGTLGYSKLGEAGYAPVPADYDGDSKADLAVYNETTGWWYYILSTTPGTLGYSKLGEAGYTPVPADYDGDGKADLAVYNETTGWWYYILSTTGALGYSKLGASGYDPVPGDYDGDGKTDLTVYQEASGWWFHILSTTHALSYEKLGEPGYTPVR